MITLNKSFLIIRYWNRLISSENAIANFGVVYRFVKMFANKFIKNFKNMSLYCIWAGFFLYFKCWYCDYLENHKHVTLLPASRISVIIKSFITIKVILSWIRCDVCYFLDIIFYDVYYRHHKDIKILIFFF